MNPHDFLGQAVLKREGEPEVVKSRMQELLDQERLRKLNALIRSQRPPGRVWATGEILHTQEFRPAPHLHLPLFQPTVSMQENLRVYLMEKNSYITLLRRVLLLDGLNPAQGIRGHFDLAMGLEGTGDCCAIRYNQNLSRYWLRSAAEGGYPPAGLELYLRVSQLCLEENVIGLISRSLAWESKHIDEWMAQSRLLLHLLDGKALSQMGDGGLRHIDHALMTLEGLGGANASTHGIPEVGLLKGRLVARRDQLSVQNGDRPGVVVVKRPIQAVSKNEEEKIRAYRRLESPIRLVEASLESVRATRQALLAEFPWFAGLTDIILGEVEGNLWVGNATVYIRPTLVAGAPGSGKTRYLQRLGEFLGPPAKFLSLAGSSDDKVLSGVTRGWSSARPSFLVDALLELEVANPIIVLDEIDKANGSDSNGHPWRALLNFLEKGNAAHFTDPFLLVEVDLSHVSYLATANSIMNLTPELLSRFRVIEVEGPKGFDHLVAVALSARNEVAREFGLDARMLPLTMDELEGLVRPTFSARATAQVVRSYLSRRASIECQGGPLQ